jgi:hypothetical protein
MLIGPQKRIEESDAFTHVLAIYVAAARAFDAHTLGDTVGQEKEIAVHCARLALVNVIEVHTASRVADALQHVP